MLNESLNTQAPWTTGFENQPASHTRPQRQRALSSGCGQVFLAQAAPTPSTAHTPVSSHWEREEYLRMPNYNMPRHFVTPTYHVTLFYCNCSYRHPAVEHVCGLRFFCPFKLRCKKKFSYFYLQAQSCWFTEGTFLEVHSAESGSLHILRASKPRDHRTSPEQE